MLLPRIITAVVLLAILLPALFAASAWPFLVVTLVMIAAAGWEWARMNGCRNQAVALGTGAALAGVCAAMGFATWGRTDLSVLWWSAAVVWSLGGAAVLRSGPAAWPRVPVVLRWLLGLCVLLAAWMAMANARERGVNFLLSVMCIVWAADIAAYFGGRAFGKKKLAPTISPGKSWAGAYSGMAGVALLAAVWVQADASWSAACPSFFTAIHQRLGLVGLALALVALTSLSVVGDLVESLVKRAAGVKDSSQLLPGHGGVLDRVDALLPVLPSALALASL